MKFALVSVYFLNFVSMAAPNSCSKKLEEHSDCENILCIYYEAFVVALFCYSFFFSKG